jgi:hypothetical protein
MVQQITIDTVTARASANADYCVWPGGLAFRLRFSVFVADEAKA